MEIDYYLCSLEDNFFKILNIMDLIEQIKQNARENRQRIVLPEGDEERTIKAADQLIADGIADVILIGPAQ